MVRCEFVCVCSAVLCGVLVWFVCLVVELIELLDALDVDELLCVLRRCVGC